MKQGPVNAWWVVCLLTGTLSVTSILATEGSVKPNIVLILADDIGNRSLSCFGGTVPTPHLDRLAREGMVFENAHAAPMCAPTRDELFTGLSRARFKGRPGLETPFFTHRLQQQGYRTGIAGKWFVGRVFDPPRRGFDEACIMVNGYRHWAPDIMVFGSGGLFSHLNQPPVQGRLNEWEIPLDGETRHRATCLPERYADEVSADFLSDFMARCRDKPFFAFYASKLVHVPQVPTPAGKPEEIAIYQKAFQLDHGRHLQAMPSHVKRLAVQQGIHVTDGKQFRLDAMATLDRMVGRVLADIDRLGLLDNTLVVFTSDNGNSALDPLPEGAERLPGRKGDSREGGTRVPLLVRWPAQVKAGTVCKDLVHVQDFGPTFLALAGIQDTETKISDGISFAPQLRGHAGTPRPWFLGTGAHPSMWLDRVRAERGEPDLASWKLVWVRGQRYKLYDDGRFYDLERDPAEAHRIPSGQGSAAAEVARADYQRVLIERVQHELSL